MDNGLDSGLMDLWNYGMEPSEYGTGLFGRKDPAMYMSRIRITKDMMRSMRFAILTKYREFTVPSIPSMTVEGGVLGL
jgi:hypothetical protein